MHPVPDIPSIDYDPRTRLVFGDGVIRRVGEFARKQKGTRALLVTDQGLAEAGHVSVVLDSLLHAGIEVELYARVRPNPTTDDVEECLSFAKSMKIDLLVGLGGGSSMDCAKGVNFLLTNGGKMEDYWGIGKATRPMLPLIAVPTTAGTGSEAQSFAVIAHPKTHLKMACGDKKAAAKVALLDPSVTLTMPERVTAVTGIDAISHAVETYVTTRRNPVSQLFSRQSWQLLCRAFPAVINDPSDLKARSAMLLGAHLGGAAIENSMLGATHAMANPLTAHFDTIHGVAIGVMLPHVVRHNATLVGSLYGDLAADAHLCEADDPDAASLLADFLTLTVARAGLPTSLTDVEQFDAGLIPTMAREADQQWTGKFNPRPMTEADFREIYRCACESTASAA
jgi:alcohol dehydrogenase